MGSSGHHSNKGSPLFKALLAQSRERVLLASLPDGRVLDASPRALALLGWELAELIDRPLDDLWPPESSRKLKGIVKRCSTRGEDGYFSGLLAHRGHHVFPVELSCSRIEGHDGPLLLLTFEDVSERLQALEDIELRNIAIANVTSGVTVADARQPDLPLIYVNQGFEDITGYSAKEAVGRSCRFLQGDDRDQPGLDTLRKALRNAEPCKVRLKNYRKDGTLFYNELHISPVTNDRGELTHFVGIQLDVTDQVRAQKSLERSEKRYRQALEQEKELNEIKTRFISMVSHEFRTPMTGIQASAGLLRRFGDKLSPDKKEQHLSNIEVSLKRMNRLLDDVLFFSQAESEKLKVELKPLNIEDYLSGFKEGIAPIYPDRDIKTNCQLAGNGTYLLDQHLLDHIMQNLVGNALKYSAPGSEVSCDVRESGGQIQLTIADRGIGIPEKDQERLFEAFHRAGNVGTRLGTGLGLNIVLRAVELLEGQIDFQSKEGKGSTFTVTLPAKTQPKD
jgi:PAS domain S-box-containing protein